MHYLLLYDVVDDYVARRTQFRNQHLEKARRAFELGELVLGGALADPVDGAALVFRESYQAEVFAKTDPYVLNGLVRSWRVRTWTTVIGDGIFPPGVAHPSGRPQPSEYAPYEQTYVDLVEGGNVVSALASQIQQTAAALAKIDDRRASEFTYAPGKWTIKQVLGHMIDTERIFAYRALRIARGDTTPLPGFEQDDYVKSANFNAQPLARLIGEFRTVRHGTLALFQGLPDDAWLRRGVANHSSVTVRGLAFHIAGHELYHMKILRERYLLEKGGYT